MPRLLPRTLIATAAAVLALGTAQAADDTQPLTRDQVRVELAQARAAGLLEPPGEAGATEAVLAAREAFNDLQTLVLKAQQDLHAQLQAAADGSAGEPDLDVYYEAGPQGPVMVLLTYDAEGNLHSADTLALTLAMVEIDLD